MSINLIVLTGRLTADPELKYTQSGKAFARFSLAVSRSYNRSEADFINCVAWEKRAEMISEYLKKGSQIGVQGHLSVRTYEDESNQKRRITEVVVGTVEFLDNKKSSSQSTTNTVSNVEKSNTIDDDDFPF